MKNISSNDFHAIVRHELLNYLTLFSCNLQLIMARYPDVAADSLTAQMRDNIHSMEQLLKEYGACMKQPKLSSCSTESLLIDIYNSCLPLFLQNNKILVLDKNNDYPIITGDPSLLKPALLNLIKNAFEASSRHQTVTIRTVEKEACFSIFIEDEGIGIAELQQTDLFAPYVTYKPNGTGLGLYLTRSIIEHHHGHIQYFSNSMGGCTFQIDLPCPSFSIKKEA